MHETEDITIEPEDEEEDEGYVDENLVDQGEDKDIDPDEGYDILTEPDYDADSEDYD